MVTPTMRVGAFCSGVDVASAGPATGGGSGVVGSGSIANVTIAATAYMPAAVAYNAEKPPVL